MGNVLKGAVYGAIGYGVTIGAGAYAMVPHLNESENQQRTAIELCAEQLPQKATLLVGELNEDCERFSYDIGRYLLPSAVEFRADQMQEVTTQNEIESKRKTISLIFAGIGGLFGAYAGALVQSSKNRKSEES